MDVEEATARDDVLHVGAAVAPDQRVSQIEFALGARREVGVAGFGRHRRPDAVHPMQIRLAEACPCGNHRHVAVIERRPVLE